MRNWIVAVALIFGLCLTPTARAADPWEGTKWKVKFTAAADSDSPNDKAFDDVLTFKGSKFSSSEFLKKGFASSEFDQRSNRGPMAGFEAEQKSEKEGTLKWSGTTTGGEVSGTLVWTKKDGSVHRYDFKGDKTAS